MPAPTVYKSSDGSAPVLDGQVGSLIAVLDACLVNGYGSKSAAGWTKPYSATNKGVYLGSAGHYLDVDDAAAGAGGAKEATVRGYETMTAVATGTGPFPTTAQAAAPGLYIRKSVAADATARGWVLFADGTTFHLFVLTGDTAGRYHSFSFGRFYSMKASDTYRSIILGHAATGASSSAGLDITSLLSDPINVAGAGCYVPRIAAGTGTSVASGLFGLGSSLFSSPFTGPSGNDGLVYLSRLFMTDGTVTNGPRGYVRGLYQIITASGLSDGDTFSGTGDFAGRTFTVLNRTRGGAYLAIETTAWDSSA